MRKNRTKIGTLYFLQMGIGAWTLVFHASARRFGDVPFWHAQRCAKAYLALRVAVALGAASGLLLALVPALVGRFDIELFSDFSSK